MATDPKTLDNPQQLRILADNARNHGRHDLALDCVARIAELAGQPFNDAMEREFWQALTVAEELRTVENGKTTRLSRTRQKLERVGVLKLVRDLAKASKPSEGFRILLDGGRPDLTAEAIIMRHPDLFEADVFDIAKAKLAAAGISVDECIRAPVKT